MGEGLLTLKRHFALFPYRFRLLMQGEFIGLTADDLVHANNQ